MMTKKKCIYCLQTNPARFNGVEHLIPQAFGTFGSATPTLDCVCDDCNADFGRHLDQLLARETYEGIGRYSRGIFSSEARVQRRLNLALADAAEAGSFVGAKVAIDGTTGNLMPIAAQFHVHNFHTGKDEIYFKHQVAHLTLPEKIYGRPGKGGEQGTWKCKVLASSKEEHDEMVEALRRAGIDFRPGQPFPLPRAIEENQTGQLSFLVEIESEVDKPHKRAIAKIFMNFVARYLGPIEALDPRWDFLRNYVRNGEGEIRARMTSGPFWTGQETDSQRFSDDSISVRIENLNGHIVGAIQFYNSHTYEMILVENASLAAGMEVGYRYTRGIAPVRGEKRRLSPSAPAA